MMQEPLTDTAFADWVRAFEQDSAGLYEDFAQELERLVRSFLRQGEFDVTSLHYRVKESSSLRDKLERKGTNYTRLSDVTDLVGLRVVAYMLTDVDAICELLQRELLIDPEHSVDKAAEKRVDEFGYLSRHLIVGLPEHRLVLSENRRFEGLLAEIQVRTALQDAWATIEHKIRYKSKFDLPTDVNRGFPRLSAVLELADFEFQRLQRDWTLAREQSLESIENDDLLVPLTTASLDAYIDTTRIDEHLADHARRLGEVVPLTSDDQRAVDRDAVVVIANRMGLQTVADFDALTEADPRESLRAIFKAYHDQGIDPDLTAGMLLAHVLVWSNDSPVDIGRDVLPLSILETLGS